MKQFFKNISLVVAGIALAAGSMVFAATWQGTSGIQDGQIISASTIKSNFDYLYERSWDLSGGNLSTNKSVSASAYCDASGGNCQTPPFSSGGSSLSQEEVQDFVGPMVSGNTETLISVDYSDSANNFSFAVEDRLSQYTNDIGFVTNSQTRNIINQEAPGVWICANDVFGGAQGFGNEVNTVTGETRSGGVECSGGGF